MNIFTTLNGLGKSTKKNGFSGDTLMKDLVLEVD
jgi:hypothetical protein